MMQTEERNQKDCPIVRYISICKWSWRESNPSRSRSAPMTISDLPAPLYLPDSEQHPEERCLVPSPSGGIKPVNYCTSFRQRERTCFRQLIFRPNGLWSIQPSLRMLTYHLSPLSNPVNPKIFVLLRCKVTK